MQTSLAKRESGGRHVAGNEPARACTTIALAAIQNGQVPDWVQLFPASSGAIATTDGRNYRLEQIDQVIARSAAEDRELAIDFDHAIDLAAKSGGRAPAAGWIQELQARPDGVWARVQWTDLGQRALAGREYRFLSPVFTYDKSGRITRVLRAGLTNDPAFQMKALAHSTPEDTVEEFLKQLAAALGLQADQVNEETALAAVTALATQNAEAVELKVLATAIGLQGDQVTAEKALAAVQDLKQKADAKATAANPASPDPAQFVDIATFKATRDELDGLKTSLAKREAEATVDAAIASGRVTPAQRNWAIAYASKDLAAFNEFVGVAPQILSSGRVATQGQGDGSAAALTPEEKAICTQMGIPEEKYLATRKVREAAQENAA